jgi:hypothetical protein
MTFATEQRLLEQVANAVGFEYLMYVPASSPHRSGLLFKRGCARMSVWNPFVDDGDLFRLAVAVPAVDLQKIINATSRSSKDELELRCEIVREDFVQAVATMATDSCSSAGVCSHRADFAVGVGHQ